MTQNPDKTKTSAAHTRADAGTPAHPRTRKLSETYKSRPIGFPRPFGYEE